MNYRLIKEIKDFDYAADDWIRGYGTFRWQPCKKHDSLTCGCFASFKDHRSNWLDVMSDAIAKILRLRGWHVKQKNVYKVLDRTIISTTEGKKRCKTK